MTMAERDVLDRWLSRSLADAREALGDGFAERYDRAPPWRRIVPDAEGQSCEAGALVPSIDAAGRRFPIYLAMIEVAREGAEGASEACETLLYNAFEAGWDVEALADAAAAAIPAAGTPYSGAARWWTLGGEGFAPASVDGECPVGLMLEVLRTREEPA